MKFFLIAALLASTAIPLAQARPIKWARVGDALTMDPHAQNEGPTLTLTHQIYESLAIRAVTGELLPNLAVSWAVTSDPAVWEFKLRPGVKFHGGEDFTAQDVVFSLNRAMSPTSDQRSALTTIDTITAIDPLTVHVKTKGANPVFPNQLTNIFMMSEKWSIANNVQKPQDYKNKEENFAVRNANGTGAFIMVSREQDVKTVMKRNEAYWGRKEFPMDITEITYVVIKSDATRVAALLSGEVDFVQDVPPQDITKLQQDPKLRVNLGPENRIIFFGMDVASKELKTSDIKGKNPFADKRVRDAMSMALNRDAIKRVVMRDQSIPAGIVLPPFVNGYTKALDVVPKVDIAGAKTLMAQAGYKDGFNVTLHCSNDRYINDEGICQAAVGMFGSIGIKVNLISQSKSLHFPLINKNPPETEFYLLGWGVPTYDSDYIFSFLYHTRSGKDGGWNATGYSNPKVDAMIKGISTQVNVSERNKEIAAIWDVLKVETPYIPIHHQTLAYAMKADLNIPTHPDNGYHMKFVSIKK